MPKLLTENMNYSHAIINASILCDERLSWAARGVMAFILSYNNLEYPMDIYSIRCATKGHSTHEVTENIEDILKELEAAGYIQSDGSGDFTDY